MCTNIFFFFFTELSFDDKFLRRDKKYSDFFRAVLNEIFSKQFLNLSVAFEFKMIQFLFMDSYGLFIIRDIQVVYTSRADLLIVIFKKWIFYDTE